LRKRKSTSALELVDYKHGNSQPILSPLASIGPSDPIEKCVYRKKQQYRRCHKRAHTALAQPFSSG